MNRKFGIMSNSSVAILLTLWRSPKRETMYDSRIEWWKTITIIVKPRTLCSYWILAKLE